MTTVTIPDLYQEVTTVLLVVLIGFALVICALILAMSAIRAKRRTGHRPWLAALVIALCIVPLIVGLMGTLEAMGCMVAGCGN